MDLTCIQCFCALVDGEKNIDMSLIEGLYLPNQTARMIRRYLDMRCTLASVNRLDYLVNIRIGQKPVRVT